MSHSLTGDGQGVILCDMDTARTTPTELLVGSYIRPDGRPYRIARLDGTTTYTAYVAGRPLGHFASKQAASKAARA